MELVYRRATVEDIEFLVDMRIKVLRAVNELDESVDMTEVEKETLKYYNSSIIDNKCIIYLAVDEATGYAAGTGGVSIHQVMPTYHNASGRKAYIMNIYTDPEYRRQGIAKKVLDLLVEECRRLGVDFITLEASCMGRPLYESCGFVQMEDEMILSEL